MRFAFLIAALSLGCAAKKPAEAKFAIPVSCIYKAQLGTTACKADPVISDLAICNNVTVRYSCYKAIQAQEK